MNLVLKRGNFELGDQVGEFDGVTQSFLSEDVVIGHKLFILLQKELN